MEIQNENVYFSEEDSLSQDTFQMFILRLEVKPFMLEQAKYRENIVAEKVLGLPR